MTVDIIDRLVGAQLAVGRGERPSYFDLDLGEVPHQRVHSAVRNYAGALR